MMDCTEIQELLGAYALGAAEPNEARWIEEHVADCMRCWEELDKEQRTVALLALAVPIEQASPQLEERLIAAARRDKVGVRTEPRTSIFQRLRFGWPATAGVLGLASVAAIVFSSALQMQVQDLQQENDQLSAAMKSSSLTLERTTKQADDVQTVLAVLSDDGAKAIKVDSANADAASADATAYYTWSPDTKKGFIRCEDMPALTPGKTYEAWVTVQKDAYPVGTFQSNTDGTCQITTDMSFLTTRPTGIGISVEAIPGALQRPTDGWMLYAHFSTN